ncbi:hypothetical protein Poly24_16070 [Rosistilla carotiformis]|uniref:Prepilin-type N-terminal cleavage/methylation domain-containing protein n=1 Tax=Rosistilla carotiformis TaxID=2528017 RepID=A0A518JQT7_9BACT|nr:prepilin-type N-terminal cleavage/methylation domain-containing protein [Rosistilla carotiformis]QDV67902.1 hypothetical protein Poly24_16070 [Rosistilla carotiformis]
MFVKDRKQRGFTLVEMLIAMTVTLLIMAGLAQTFSVIGTRIRETTVEVGLSTKLRGVAMQLRNDLEYRTVQNISFDRGQEDGYFVYYEGPVADVTTSVAIGREDVSKWGDFDDYIAFTAQAPPGAYFTGSVPKFIADGTGTDMTPVTIRSEYAEIIYWIGPTYNETGGAFSIDTIPPLPVSGTLPTAVPVPNRLQLHRRVLLIRPDLNNNTMSWGEPYLQLPAAYQAGAWANNIATAGWLTGMAKIHQMCDLSVSRITQSALSGSIGWDQPRTEIRANSLKDLSRPENRFAHVRMPLPTTGVAKSTLPLLAMGNPSALSALPTPAASGVARANTNPAWAFGSPHLLQGFLLPDFALGLKQEYQVPQTAADLTSQTTTYGYAMPAGWGGDRRGEDVVLDDMLGFDVKLFDRSTALVMLPGDDGNPGNNQTGAGSWQFMGEANSDDVLITPNDPGYRYFFDANLDWDGTDDSSIAVRSAQNHPTGAANNDPLLISRGAFVDLGYATLRGGNVRARMDPMIQTMPTNVGVNARLLLESEFSGAVYDDNTGALDHMRSLRLSGKYGYSTVTGGARWYQPVFDTWSVEYSEGFPFEFDTTYNTMVWPIPTGTVPRAPIAGELDAMGSAVPPFQSQPAAIQVTLRIEDKRSRQIRQLTVSENL